MQVPLLDVGVRHGAADLIAEDLGHAGPVDPGALGGGELLRREELRLLGGDLDLLPVPALAHHDGLAAAVHRGDEPLLGRRSDVLVEVHFGVDEHPGRVPAGVEKLGAELLCRQAEADRLAAE